MSGMIGQINYTVAKAGIIGFTKAAALELARYNVTVNVVAPGYTRSKMFDSGEKPGRQPWLRCLLAACEPEEVARAVRYLIVVGDYITGTTLILSGGIYPRTALFAGME
jgi:acetoacetyl-CoA reductase